MLNNPCRRPGGPGDPLGAPCPSCGHTNLLHPGTLNPRIDECLVCVTEAALAVVKNIAKEWDGK